jgi:DNA-binding NtrC family response regulator
VLSNALEGCQPDAVVLCLVRRDLKHAKALFGMVQELLLAVPIIVAAEVAEPKELCRLRSLGAVDFVTPPFRSLDLLARVCWNCRPTSEADQIIPAKCKGMHDLKQILGESPALHAELEKVQAITRCNASVLITGETGTGKEMFARAIHHLSPRAEGCFVPVNCGAMPVDLVENELFGHESGAFTSASSAQLGLIHAADGGTLFLDEIDGLPMLAQVKLLRFLQEKEFRPLGSRKACKADVRVVAASNISLDEAAGSGRFRRDLYYRLNVVQIALPPLRRRTEDIPLLARYFLAKYCEEYARPPKGFHARCPPEALALRMARKCS